MAKKTPYIVALGGIVLLCVLISWGFKRNQSTPSSHQGMSKSLQEQPTSVTSENANVSKHGALTKEEVSEFLEEQRMKLVSEYPKQRQQAVSMILEERRKNISLLTQIIGAEIIYQENPEIIIDAMRLLGKLRAKKALVPLIEHIDFQRPGADFPSGGGSILSGREAVDALIEIGKPAVPDVIEALREDDYIKIECTAAVIEKVEGKEAGVLYLQKLIDKETDPKKQAMLRKVKNSVQTPPRGRR